MTAINHAVTGAVVGLIIGQPVVALPVAFMSHFVCDAIPHFGIKDDGWIRSKAFRNLILVDSMLCILLVGMLAATHPHHWLLAAACAFLATSPDLLWLNHFIKARSGKPWKANVLEKFAAGIQWFERPSGAIVEVAWLIAGISMLTVLVK